MRVHGTYTYANNRASRLVYTQKEQQWSNRSFIKINYNQVYLGLLETFFSPTEWSMGGMIDQQIVGATSLNAFKMIWIS